MPSPSPVKLRSCVLQSVRKLKKLCQKKPYVNLSCEMPLALVWLVTNVVMLRDRGIFLNEM